MNVTPLRQQQRDVPPSDVDAEKAVLGAVLTIPELASILFEVCAADHFYLDAHKWIARAIIEAEPPNITTVATWLRDCGRLQTVGGTQYIAELFDSVPASSASDVEGYARIIRAKWELRTAKAHAMALAALCQTGTTDDLSAAFRAAANDVDRFTNGDKAELLSGIEIFNVPARIDTLVAAIGLKPGPPTMVAARGGIGKSVALQSLALSCVVGKPAWGLFPIARPLRVLWIDLEQGKQTTLLRFKRLAQAMDLTPEDLQGKLGVLISPDVSDEAKLARLFSGYDLAVIDCYRVLAAGVDENSSAAREPLDACARASEKAGCAVMVIHHGRKAAENNRGGTRDVTRGSSAIQDACDAVFYLDRDTEESEGPIACACVKVPRATGKCPNPWTLTIEDCDLYYSADDVAHNAGLRVVGRREQRQDPFESEAAQNRSYIERLKLDLIAEFRKSPTQPGADTIAARLGRKAANVRTALLALIDEGLVRVEGKGRSTQHVWVGGSK